MVWVLGCLSACSGCRAFAKTCQITRTVAVNTDMTLHACGSTSKKFCEFSCCY